MPHRHVSLLAKFAKFYGLQQRLFDLYLGTSTAGRGDLDGPGRPADSLPYEGCQWPAVSHALRELRPNDSEVFVDFGAGKGKALLIAGRLPYQRVVGVEADDELAVVARRNIAKAGRRLRAGRTECLTASVLGWPVPEDSSIFFMYNPFLGETFRHAVSAVFESYDKHPRKLHLVYQYPREHNWLISTGRVVVENVRPMRWPARRRWWVDEDEKVIVTYHVIGEGGQMPVAGCLPRERAASEAMLRWGGTVRSPRASASPG
jgi:predicted RNA methylase